MISIILNYSLSCKAYVTRYWSYFLGGFDEEENAAKAYDMAALEEEKAAKAYDMAALKYWGPRATTNFPVWFYVNSGFNIF